MAVTAFRVSKCNVETSVGFPSREISGRISDDLPGDQQQAPPAISVGIVDSFTISRRVSVAEMLHIPGLCKKSRMASIVWNSGAGSALLGVRSIALR
jgi:hypothetical protein